MPSQHPLFQSRLPATNVSLRELMAVNTSQQAVQLQDDSRARVEAMLSADLLRALIRYPKASALLQRVDHHAFFDGDLAAEASHRRRALAHAALGGWDHQVNQHRRELTRVVTLDSSLHAVAIGKRLGMNTKIFTELSPEVQQTVWGGMSVRLNSDKWDWQVESVDSPRAMTIPAEGLERATALRMAGVPFGQVLTGEAVPHTTPSLGKLMKQEAREAGAVVAQTAAMAVLLPVAVLSSMFAPGVDPVLLVSLPDSRWLVEVYRWS